MNVPKRKDYRGTNRFISSYSFAIGIVGDAGVRGSAQQPRLYVGMILILIFAEVLGEFLIFIAFSTPLTIFSRSLWFDCGSPYELAGFGGCYVRMKSRRLRQGLFNVRYCGQFQERIQLTWFQLRKY